MSLGPYTLGPAGDGIYTGDARDLARAIPDESIDLICTDPVYERIEDFAWLSSLARRVLKQDSTCLVFCGIGWLDRALAALSTALDYRWCLVASVLNSRNIAGSNWLYRKWQCLLWMQKGVSNPTSYRIQDVRSVILTGKSNHIWTKRSTGAALAHWIGAFSGNVVFDPFCGGGTTPAVCKMLGRQWLAFEIDADTAETARQRVRETNPPLPGINDDLQQLELL